MTTIIHSNGSKWAGQEPDSIETLLNVLANYTLDCGHAPFAETAKPGDRWAPVGMTRFHGNFLTLSHVFSIDTDDKKLIVRLNAAIAENMKRADYGQTHSWPPRKSIA